MIPADIIYTPISDTPLPKDSGFYRDWAKTYDNNNHHVFGGMSEKQQASRMKNLLLNGLKHNSNIESTGVDRYPWDIRHALLAGKYVDHFNEYFPETLDWLSEVFQTPKSTFQKIVLITVKDKFTNDLENNAWHNDEDWGLRFYMENEDDTCSTDPILFMPTNKKYESLAERALDVGLAGSQNLRPDNESGMLLQKDKILESKPLKNTTAYYINNMSASHAPVITQKRKRTAGFLVLNDYSYAYNTVIESAHKYKENVLLWTPPEISSA